MKKLMGGVFALFLLIFLNACPVEYPGPTVPGSGPGGRVLQPFIDTIPIRLYNNAPMQISFRSNTPNAVFYYTLDGSIPSPENGIRYNGPFYLEPGNVNISNTPRHGHIQIRVIGTREGMTDSLIRNQDLQIFETVPASEWGNMTTGVFHGTGQGYFGGTVRVGLRLVDGIINHAEATFVTGYGGTPPCSSNDFDHAVNHARAFLALMNHWDFDARTGATGSSAGIRTAARQALVNAGVIQD